MDGLKLKEILTKNGYLLKDIAAKLGMTQPNFSQITKAQDVKSGTLENICDALGVTMDFFYGGTRFNPVAVPQENKPTEDNKPSDEELNQKVLYLQGQLAAMKEAYRTLLDSMASSSSSNALRQVVNE